MAKRGRKKVKYGKNQTYFLSNESIAKLGKLSKGKPSQYLENLIIEQYNLHAKDWRIEDQRVQTLLTSEEVLNEQNSLLLQ